jgi:tetratricopeptide (TPR) repeat protein
VTRRRSGDPRAWLALARSLPGPAHAAEVLAALDQAIALAPRMVEAHDLKAERLAELGRYDEAMKAASTEALGEDLPLVLRGRIAWIEARRGNFASAIPPMQKLVAVEPAYYWGWQQLAEWYNETGKRESYLEAASEMVRLRQDSPVALAMRGDARLQTGDRDGGKADLRQAQQIAPGYPSAGMLLFDAYLADGELDAAGKTLAILQEHVGDAIVLARQVQLAARQGDRQAAGDALRQTARADCESSWPVQLSLGAMREAGWGDEAQSILHEVLHDDEPFHPWAAIAWVDGHPGDEADTDEKLAVLDRAIRLHPQFVQAYDYKAEILARASRFADALTACRPPDGGEAPLILLGRAAWVEAQRGDRKAAIAQMRRLVEKDPDYTWGWQQLANWYDAEANHAEYLKATEQLVRLAPADASAYGRRGDAKLYSGDRSGAKADFRKAFDLDPMYTFAALHLIDEYLTDGEMEEAGEALDRLRGHAEGAYVQLRVIRLAIQRRDREGAMEAWRHLAMDEDAPPPMVREAMDGLAEAGWGDEADQALVDLLTEEDAPPSLGRVWVERSVARKAWDCVERFEALLERGEVGHEALGAYIDGLGEPQHKARLKECVQRFGEALRGTTRGWGKAGCALTGAEEFTLASAWMHDWRDRADAEPWMLINLAIALRSIERDGEAHAVHEKALSLPEADYTSPFHSVWLAVDAGLAGDPSGVARHLQGIDPESLDDYHRLLHALALAMRTVQESRGNYPAARRQVTDAVATYRSLDPDPGLFRTYKQCVRRIARDAGGAGAWLWALGQRVRLPLPRERKKRE